MAISFVSCNQIVFFIVLFLLFRHPHRQIVFCRKEEKKGFSGLLLRLKQLLRIAFLSPALTRYFFLFFVFGGLRSSCPKVAALALLTSFIVVVFHISVVCRHV